MIAEIIVLIWKPLFMIMLGCMGLYFMYKLNTVGIKNKQLRKKIYKEEYWEDD